MNFFATISKFLDSGGYVLWILLAVTFAMWTIICERYWFFYRVYPNAVNKVVNHWRQGSWQKHWHQQKAREKLLSEQRQELMGAIPLLNILVKVCPLLGLLGTVSGMIAVFDVIAFVGTSNAQLFSAGISMATIPTFAGLVASLSALYFGNYLEKMANQRVEQLTELTAV